jgi:hypothetical protein
LINGPKGISALLKNFTETISNKVDQTLKGMSRENSKDASSQYNTTRGKRKKERSSSMRSFKGISVNNPVASA